MGRSRNGEIWIVCVWAKDACNCFTGIVYLTNYIAPFGVRYGIFVNGTFLLMIIETPLFLEL